MDQSDFLVVQNAKIQFLCHCRHIMQIFFFNILKFPQLPPQQTSKDFNGILNVE